mmetsp:Transcript_44941/g.71795  ORF Transcript_44941/g.71795 Transcript_44941/m.71795 type:complete len:249 (+) Transcript_44941:63-809(+)
MFLVGPGTAVGPGAASSKIQNYGRSCSSEPRIVGFQGSHIKDPLKRFERFGYSAPEWRPYLDDWRPVMLEDLCKMFKIHDPLRKRLHFFMMQRLETFLEDIESLLDDLALARHPPGLLSAKLRQMEEKTFTARLKPAWMRTMIDDMCDKFNLDNESKIKLNCVLALRKDTFKETMDALFGTLSGVRCPSRVLWNKMLEMEDEFMKPESCSRGRSRSRSGRTTSTQPSQNALESANVAASRPVIHGYEW